MNYVILLVMGLFLQSPQQIDFNINPIEDGNYTANIESSEVSWKAYKVGGQHNGVVNLKDGDLQFENGQLVGGSFSVDMTSIVCLDLEGEWKGKLEGHLKSDDFFGVNNFPTAKFVITDAFAVGTEGKYRIKGDLTIKEKTESIAFNAMVTEEGNMVKANADLVIDRSKFDVRYGSGSFFDNLGDKTIYDEFDLSVSLTAAK